MPHNIEFNLYKLYSNKLILKKKRVKSMNKNARA